MDLVKHRMKIDDSLDVLAVHGFGGATGTLLVAFLAGFGDGATGLSDGMTMGSQFIVQLTGVVAVAVWSVIATVIIVMVTKAIIGLRVTDEEEIEGLDFSAHGESAYKL